MAFLSLILSLAMFRWFSLIDETWIYSLSRFSCPLLGYEPIFAFLLALLWPPFNFFFSIRFHPVSTYFFFQIPFRMSFKLHLELIKDYCWVNHFSQELSIWIFNHLLVHILADYWCSGQCWERWDCKGSDGFEKGGGWGRLHNGCCCSSSGEILRVLSCCSCHDSLNPLHIHERHDLP